MSPTAAMRTSPARDADSPGRAGGLVQPAIETARRTAEVVATRRKDLRRESAGCIYKPFQKPDNRQGSRRAARRTGTFDVSSGLDWLSMARGGA
ncbi:hypothetical protein ACW0JT_09900 [Arthrobacter sp. SA17]